MLKKIFLALALIGLLVSYGFGFIPVDYKFGSNEQSTLASMLVDSNISNFSLCILDVYKSEEVTDLTLAKVKTTKTIQFNTTTLVIKTKYEVVDEEGNVVEEAQDVLNTLGLTDFEFEGHYKVINRKIYVAATPEALALTEDGYMFTLDTFYQVSEKGEEGDTLVSGVAVGITVILVGVVATCLVMFAIKKPEED